MLPPHTPIVGGVPAPDPPLLPALVRPPAAQRSSLARYIHISV